MLFFLQRATFFTVCIIFIPFFQLRGQKTVILFEPYQNEQFYEGHIAQATLSYNKTGHRFRRYKLEESTSMVMSPVDMLNPNFEVWILSVIWYYILLLNIHVTHFYPSREKKGKYDFLNPEKYVLKNFVTQLIKCEPPNIYFR